MNTEAVIHMILKHEGAIEEIQSTYVKKSSMDRIYSTLDTIVGMIKNLEQEAMMTLHGLARLQVGIEDLNEKMTRAEKRLDSLEDGSKKADSRLSNIEKDLSVLKRKC